jgi:glyoxylase-like metal-dependent hydrolase (beta-lactamase superfamily II)
LDPTTDLSERPKPLPEYLKNLGLTKALDVDLVLPGHGSPFTDHAAVIDERFKMHERRAAKLLAALSDRPLSAFELAEGLWGNIAYTQTFLALSEVVGHMDLLEVDGAVTELPADSQGVVRYQAS